MKDFVIQPIFMKKSPTNVCLTGLVLLFAMPLYAENNYLFPSDIIDQSEQVTYEANRADRYEKQRDWTYPEDIRADARPNASQTYSPDSRHYTTVEEQSVSHQGQPDYGSSRYSEPEHYQYSDTNLKKQSRNYRPADNLSEQAPGYASQNRSTPGSQRSPQRSSQRRLQPGSPEVLHYPGEKHANDIERRTSEKSMEMKPRIYTVKKDERKGQYEQQYSNLLYASDVEPDRRSANKKNGAMQYQYKPQNWAERARQNDRIQYVPVPVYGIPRTLPGTVPGVVTPGHMMPGYSHINPNYNYGGLNNFFGSPYSPWTSFGAFPGIGNPFGHGYSNYGNNPQYGWPFAAPNFLAPGFSNPTPFLSR